MSDELRRQQEQQQDHDALAGCDEQAGPASLPIPTVTDDELAALLRGGVQVDATMPPNRWDYRLEQSPAVEMDRLRRELAADPLSRAYQRLRNATTGKQIRSARAAVRRAARHKMVRTMCQNSHELRARPQLARQIAAEVVRKEMGTHGN